MFAAELGFRGRSDEDVFAAAWEDQRVLETANMKGRTFEVVRLFPTFVWKRQFDQATYSDNGQPIATEYQSPWLTMDEPRRSVNIKDGRYIQPIIDTGSDTVYTIMVEAGFQGTSTDTIVVTASGNLGRPIGSAVVGTDVIGGSSLTNEKFPLRWRGDVI